ncbi:MAG TPA: M48 family metallopeptidase [Chitinophagales bacterium]|nr:M48 family metallopeptidase [Chitinophagales bacterium]
MKKIFLAVITLIVLSWACSTVPLTGRKQLNLLPESELQQMSLAEYKSFLAEQKVINNTEQSAMVKRVGQKIAASATAYLNQEGYGERVKGYQWEFNLVEDKTVNAWCMPGGKVVVYTGILPVTQTEAGLAVVMGHEISHAIAQHGNERMSQQLAVALGGIALDVALSNKPQETRNIFLASYGVGATLGVILPYSRKHESEADKMGLIFMAKAGYDPHEAVSFWKRMAAKGGQKPPQFLSTHPSDEKRIADLQKFLPEAMKHYHPK